MKNQTFKFLFLLLCSVFIGQQGFAQTAFTLTNSLTTDRTNELVEVLIDSETATSLATKKLVDEDNQDVPYQYLKEDGKLIFQATVAAGQTKTYSLVSGTPATVSAKTYANIMMPSSRADIAWENDRTAYRMYSRTLLNTDANTSNGVDLWVKKMSIPVVEKMYTYSNYHSEQPEGVDAYSVNGKTLGAGGVVAYSNSKMWLHDPYDECEIIENGPLRTEFVLTYKRVEIDGDYYTKTVRITTSANGLLNKAVVKYDGTIKAMKIAAGIYLHTNTNGVQYKTESNVIGYAEDKSEGTVTSPNARFYTGIYMPGVTTVSTVDNHLVIMSDYAVGSEFTYYFGGGWNIFPAGEYSVDQDWFNALKSFKQKDISPLLPVDVTKLPSKKDVINVGTAINGYWIGNNPSPGNNLWRWATYNMGNVEFYKVYPEYKYLKYSLLWGNNKNWAVDNGPSTHNADNHTCGQAYIDLYELTGATNTDMIKNIKATMDYQITNRTQSADWWWIDAMFMAMPVFTRLGNVYNDTKYYDKMYDMFKMVRDTLLVNSSHSSMWPPEYRTLYGNGPVISGYEGDGLYDPTDHLWWRDWGFQPNMPPKKDPNTSPSWMADVPDVSPNGKNIYWSRGNGWVLAAMARTLMTLPETDPHRGEYLEMFLDMCEALKNCQREDGFWNMNLGDADHFPGAETSGTALFTYGMAWGIRAGILDRETYYPVVAKAWNGLASQAVEKSGRVKLIQNEGEGPVDASRLTSNVDFCIGVMLLTVSEVAQIAEGEMPEVPEIPLLIETAKLRSGDASLLDVTYDATVDMTTAINKDNYSISGDVGIRNIIANGTKAVVIMLDKAVDYGRYTLTVSDVKGEDGTKVEDNTSQIFVNFVPLDDPDKTITVTAIGNQAGNPPANAVDRNILSRWAQAGKNQWILFDLGREEEVYAVDIAYYEGTKRLSYFDVQVSTDKVNFTTVLSDQRSSGLGLNMERYAFTPQTVRYVRIMCNGNSLGGENWNSITEARIRYKVDVSIDNVESADDAVYVYPNPLPNGNSLSVVLKNKVSASEVNYSIYDMNGKKFLSDRANLDDNQFVINNLTLTPDKYLLVIQNGKESWNKIFIIK